MPGCCLIAALLFFGPRVVLLLAWLFSDWYVAFESPLVALLGWLFLPWTSLAWMYTFFTNAGAVAGGYLLLFVVGVLADLGAFGGGARWRGNGKE
jgi:hypothetical protein